MEFDENSLQCIIVIQLNLSKPNLLGINCCVQNRQVSVFAQVKLTKNVCIKTSFKVRFMQDFGLDRFHCIT